jgi:hypothetical protein
VLIVAKEKKTSLKSFADLAGKAQSISIGQPETVPAGKYAKETLTNLRLWDKLEKRIMFAKDVRQVLAYVESGNVDAGLVYQSDTLALKSGAVVEPPRQVPFSHCLSMAEIWPESRLKPGNSCFSSANAAKIFENTNSSPCPTTLTGFIRKLRQEKIGNGRRRIASWRFLLEPNGTSRLESSTLPGKKSTLGTIKSGSFP